MRERRIDVARIAVVSCKIAIYGAFYGFAIYAVAALVILDTPNARDGGVFVLTFALGFLFIAATLMTADEMDP